MAYCTPQDVINFCSWYSFGQFNEQVQDGLIAAASDQIDVVTRRRFGFDQQSITEIFDGYDQDALWLSHCPVVQVSGITVDGWPLDNFDGSGWTLNGVTGKLVRGGGHEDPRFALRWPSGSGNIAVQYWGGYAVIPPIITLATAWTVRYFYDQGTISGAVSQETIGRYTRSIRQLPLTAGLPSHIMGLLDSFTDNAAFA